MKRADDEIAVITRGTQGLGAAKRMLAQGSWLVA